MTQTNKPELPIGYWLKRADSLLTEQINQLQARHGVSRTDWQTLNLLNESGSSSKERLFESMRTFVDAAGLDEILSRLSQRGWIERGPVSGSGTSEFQLTAEGRRQHTVILATQKEAREKAMRGISAEEYATAIKVLKQIVSNLEGNSKN